MPLTFQKAAILGATGPTGKFLVRELLGREIRVRVVSRSESNLSQVFGGLNVERVAADMLDSEGSKRAVDGCGAVFDCIGLPMARIADHPPTAKNIAGAIQSTGARCVHVSSYWAYLPLQRSTLDEQHPRQGGNTPVKMRREAEDILKDAGAAVVNLPDFYGPEVHTSILQQALTEALAGKTVNWIGSPDTAREHIFIPDGMKAVTELAFREEAYGEFWIVPGAGPISLNQIAAICERHLGRAVKTRGAGALMLRIVSLFSPQLRSFMPMVPEYLKPLSFDGSKLKHLIGEVPATSYEEAIPRTLDWLKESSG